MENKVKKCKYCGTEMDESAKICPNCKKNQKMSAGKIVLIVIGVFVILCILASIGGDSNTTNTTSNNNVNENNDVQQTETTNTEEEKTEYTVGEVFSDKYMKVTYLSLNNNFTGYSQYAKVKDGCKVIAASFEFENVSSTDQLASSYNFTCYADGYNCDSFYYVDDSSFSANLSAGKKITGTVYFEVPVNATDVTIEYENNVWTSNKVVFRVK